MRSEERLRKLKKWTFETVCAGRSMKTPAQNMDVREIRRQEPKVYLAFPPARPDTSDIAGDIDPLNVAPGIIIAPDPGTIKYMEEQRFDRYNNVHWPKSMGQSLPLQVLFFVYEDGVRLPGFVESAKSGPYGMNLITEGTEEGLFTLYNWMDDFKDALLSQKVIPDTDMVLNESEGRYGMYQDQRYVSDRRPIFIGIVPVTFQCFAEEYNEEINRLLN